MMSSAVLLRVTIACACFVGVYQAFVFYLGSFTSTRFETTWSVVLAALLAFWVDEDSKAHPDIPRPSFDYVLMIYVFWIVYLPYYLLSTRGRAGWLWIAAFAFLALLGWILQWVVYWFA